MTINNFLNDFHSCPWCNNKLTLRGVSSRGSNTFSFQENPNQLDITIHTDYFMEPNYDYYDYSITLSNNEITACPRAFNFAKMYDIAFKIEKSCLVCSVPPIYQRFLQEIDIYYDRTIGIFAAKLGNGSFSFLYNDVWYQFCINAKINQAYIVNASNGKRTETHVPIIPLNKFVFKNKSRLVSKLNSLQLLV